MAAKTFGTVHLYGVDTSISDATVISFSVDKTHGVNDTTKSEAGIIVDRRYDDEITTASMTIRMQSGYSKPGIGTQLTYDSVIYIIEDTSDSQENEGYQTFTLSLVTSEGITLV